MGVRLLTSSAMTNIGRGDDVVGNPDRAPIVPFELFELFLYSY